MRVNIHIILLMSVILILLVPASMNAQNDISGELKIGSPIVEPIYGGDSLSVRISVNADGMKLGGNDAVTVKLFLTDGERNAELPPLILSGEKRYRFERRNAALSGNSSWPYPGKAFVTDTRKLSGLFEYDTAVPFLPWLQGAVLHTEYIYGRKCRNLPTGSSNLDLYWNNADVVKEKELPAGYEDMIYVILPDDIHIPSRKEKFSTTFYFPLNTDVFDVVYHGNRRQFGDILSVTGSLTKEGGKIISPVTVTGYASPEGPYTRNEDLARARTFNCMHRLIAEGMFERKDISPGWVAEDWEGIEDYLMACKPYKWEEALDLIREVGIFNGRERMLMDIDGGRLYKEMFVEAFPDLRRVEVSFDYMTRGSYPAESLKKLETDPGSASTGDVFAAASPYGLSDAEFRHIYGMGAELFPKDAAVNNNLAAAYLVQGDTAAATKCLERIDETPETFINRGVCCFLEGDISGARLWFIKAVKGNYMQAADYLLLLEKLE